MSKVNKTDAEGHHYWERGDTAGRPFLIAVADFHKQAEQERLASMTYSHSAIWRYLYGQGVKWQVVNGSLVTETFAHPPHVYGTKEVPTGFFDQPGTEHVSAVLFSNAGTIAKFDRMGVVAGFGATSYHYQRSGYRYDPDPDAAQGVWFSEDVAAQSYSEGWSDELQIFHNPNAWVPLPPEWLTGVAQFFWGEEVLLTTVNFRFLSTESCALRIGGGLFPMHPAGLASREEASRDARMGDENAVEALPGPGRLEGGVVQAIRGQRTVSGHSRPFWTSAAY